MEQGPFRPASFTGSGASLVRRQGLVPAAPGSWALVVAYALAVVVISQLVPSHLPLGDWTSVEDENSRWELSSGMSGSRAGAGSVWRGTGPGVLFAARWRNVSVFAFFMELEVCLAAPPPEGALFVFLASENQGALDFNRQYGLYGFDGAGPQTCLRETFPRIPGDGPAALQIQLHSDGGLLRFAKLASRPLEENANWLRWRLALLPLGLVLIALAYRPYLRARPGVIALVGLLGLASILFGCLATVDVKAFAFEILTGGRELALETPTAVNAISRQALDPLLRQPFPLGGFSIFTYLHAVLFCGTTLMLGLLRRSAPLEMLALAPVTEVMQTLVPGRGPGLSDALVDISGVAFATLLLIGLWRTERIGLLLKH